MSASRSKSSGLITDGMCVRASGLVRLKEESRHHFFGRITHLQLQRKGIRDLSHLRHCSKLQVLYLSENEVSDISPLNHLRRLYQVRLESNHVSDLSVLTSASLRNLFLDDNEISLVSGLCSCSSLEQLHISAQRVTELDIEPGCGAALSDGTGPSLKVLDISGNRLTTAFLHALSTWKSLEELVARDCDLSAMQMLRLVGELPSLQRLDLRGNPGWSDLENRHLKEYLLMASRFSLTELNGDTVLPRDISVAQHVAVIQHQQHQKRQQREHAHAPPADSGRVAPCPADQDRQPLQGSSISREASPVPRLDL